MKIRFYIDPETEQPHVHNHGVREDEVEDVLGKPGEDRLIEKPLKAYRRRRRRKTI